MGNADHRFSRFLFESKDLIEGHEVQDDAHASRMSAIDHSSARLGFDDVELCVTINHLPPHPLQDAGRFPLQKWQQTLSVALYISGQANLDWIAQTYPSCFGMLRT